MLSLGDSRYAAANRSFARGLRPPTAVDGQAEVSAAPGRDLTPCG